MASYHVAFPDPAAENAETMKIGDRAARKTKMTLAFIGKGILNYQTIEVLCS